MEGAGMAGGGGEEEGCIAGVGESDRWRAEYRDGPAHRGR